MHAEHESLPAPPAIAAPDQPVLVSRHVQSGGQHPFPQKFERRGRITRSLISSQAGLQGRDLGTGRRRHGIGQAKARDQTDLAERGAPLSDLVQRETTVHGSNDGSRVVPAHRQDEGHGKFRHISRIESVQLRQLIGVAGIEAGASLFRRRRLRQRGSAPRAQLRVRADQRHLVIDARLLHHAPQSLE